LEWGDHVALLERSQRLGNKTALDDRPTLYADLEFYLDAFFFLSNSRAEGGGILVSEIIVYGQLIQTHNLVEFVQTVKLIDNLYMRLAMKKLEKANG
jgi:hypothetical protein